MGKLLQSAMNFYNSGKVGGLKTNYSPKVSVVIPIYYPYHIDAVMDWTCKNNKFYELILVDDTGDDSFTLGSLSGCDAIIAKHNYNLGRPAARNTGAALASGDVIVFMDQDMLLSPDFALVAANLIAENGGKGIALGLRETVAYDFYLEHGFCPGKTSNKDWRVETKLLDSFIDLTVCGVGKINNNCDPGETLKIYEKTSRLELMGIEPSKTIGFWDLPSMVISHSMAISREEFFRIGGFPEWISGWGGEDIILGFAAIAGGNPIIMTDKVSLQIQHPPYSGSEMAKMRELSGNISKYRKWAHNADYLKMADVGYYKSRVRVIN